MSRFKLSYANVMVTILAFIVLAGGTAYAANQLAKNSVGTKQLKKNAVNGAKVKDHSLTGKDINLAKLGTVPSAASAANATTATTAGSANALSPIEPTHIVGASGQPPFLDGSSNVGAEGPFKFQPAGFYKDHEGIVHLRGVVKAGPTEPLIFTLPPGFRPASGAAEVFPGLEKSVVFVFGSNEVIGSQDVSGDIFVTGEAGKPAILSGITFRAES
jgi:hypothetical protein